MCLCVIDQKQRHTLTCGNSRKSLRFDEEVELDEEVNGKKRWTSREVEDRTQNIERKSLHYLLLLKEKYSRKNRRFQLPSLHTRHAFTCTPINKAVKNYCLQDCLGDFVSSLRNCCVLRAFIMRFIIYVRQSCWVHKRAPHWVRAHPLVYFGITFRSRNVVSSKRKSSTFHGFWTRN